MKALGNVLWLILAGLWLAIGYAIAGVFSLIFIITIPFGLQSFKLASYVLWPFGKVVVVDPDRNKIAGTIGNVIWIVISGIWLAIAHVIIGAILCATVVGIPFGMANFRLARLALWPFGKLVLSESTAKRMNLEPIIAVRQLDGDGDGSE